MIVYNLINSVIKVIVKSNVKTVSIKLFVLIINNLILTTDLFDDEFKMMNLKNDEFKKYIYIQSF